MRRLVGVLAGSEPSPFRDPADARHLDPPPERREQAAARAYLLLEKYLTSSANRPRPARLLEEARDRLAEALG